MKTFTKILGVTLAAGTLTWGCTQDKVAPKGENGSPSIGLASDVHPVLNPGCSDTAYFRLQGPSGSYTVDYLCNNNCPQWGSVYVVNGLDSIGIYMSMTTGWLIDYNRSRFAVASSFNFELNGRPSLVNTPDWKVIDVNPLVNKAAIFVDKDDIAMDANKCFSVALNITAVRASFLGSVIPASVRQLWGVNENWDNAGNQWASTSPYLLNWCWENCPPVWPEPVEQCARAFAGLPGNNGCTTLTPDVTGAVGTLTYAWETGATSPSLSVCPTTATTYRVSVSDDNGPFSVTDFNVNVVDAGCRAGNSPQHKVWVCHLPPGNPANQQDICIDWSGVPAHVARFRPLGPDGLPIQMGHDSGCEIGKCGSNPCL